MSFSGDRDRCTQRIWYATSILVRDSNKCHEEKTAVYNFLLVMSTYWYVGNADRNNESAAANIPSASIF